MNSSKELDEECIRRLATVLRDSHDAITLQDVDGRISAWNRGAELMYGYSEEEALSMNIDRLTEADAIPQQRDVIRRLLAGETVTSFETRRVAKDGQVLDVWITITLLRDDEGRPLCLAFTERDITERKRVEKQLQEKKKELHILVGNTSDIIWAVDGDQRYTFVCPKVRDVLGYEPEDLIGRTPYELMEEEEGRRVSEVVSGAIAARQPFSLLENVNVHKDGHLVVLESSGVPVFGDDGEFRGYQGVARDITERKQMEEALREHMDELQRWHDVTMGREGRVMELKKEVNSLLAKEGQPPRYRDFIEGTGTR